MSIFETVAWTGKGLLFLAEHLARLQQAAIAAGFPFLKHLTPGQIAELELPSAPGVLRLYLTAGDGSPLAPVTEPRAFALFEPTDFPTVDALHRGYSLHLSAAPFPIILGGWKTANYWPNIQALAEAKRHGADEALVCNAAGALVSAAMANVFLVLDGRLCTPARETGARDGVIRAWVKSHAAVEEDLIKVDDISRVEECFLTNSRLGVMPVTSIDGRKLAGRTHADYLASLYRETIPR